MSTVKQTRTANLDQHHQAALAQISSTPQTVAQIAASLPLEWPGESQATHLLRVQARLEILIGEGLATQLKDTHGKPTGQYQVAP